MGSADSGREPFSPLRSLGCFPESGTLARMRSVCPRFPAPHKLVILRITMDS